MDDDDETQDDHERRPSIRSEHDLQRGNVPQSQQAQVDTIIRKWREVRQ